MLPGFIGPYPVGALAHQVPVRLHRFRRVAAFGSDLDALTGSDIDQGEFQRRGKVAIRVGDELQSGIALGSAGLLVIFGGFFGFGSKISGDEAEVIKKISASFSDAGSQKVTDQLK